MQRMRRRKRDEEKLALVGQEEREEHACEEIRCSMSVGFV